MYKERTVDDWIEEINNGLEFRRLYGKEDGWADIEALAYNVHTSQANSGPNLIYSMGDDLLSTLNVPNPMILVEPTKQSEIDSAPVIEAVDNQLIGQMKMNEEVEMGTFGSYMWGTSFFKIGYDSEFGWSPKFDYNGPKEPVGMSLTQLNSKQQMIEFNEYEPGMPWYRSCLPHDIVVPYGCRDLDSAAWVAHRVVRHIDCIKDDVKYSKKSDLVPTMSMEDFVKSYQTVVKPYRMGSNNDMVTGVDTGKGGKEFCELWEIHDKATGKIFVIATGHDQFLRNESNSLQLYGLPFVELGFTPKVRNIWRTSDADYLLQAQAELSDISIQGTKQRRANVLKFLYDVQQITKLELEKLLSADVGIAAGVTANKGDLRNVIIPLQMGQNQNLYQEADFVRSNARETTGFTRTQAGEYAGARTSAFEVQKVQAARDMRMSRRQGRIAGCYMESMRKVNEIIFKYWKTPRLIKTLDVNGIEQWMSYTGSALKGKYSYKLTFNSAPLETEDSRRQEASQAYMTLSQDPTVDPIALRRYLARSYRDIQFSSIFKPGILDQQPTQPGEAPAGAEQVQAGNTGGLRLAGA